MPDARHQRPTTSEPSDPEHRTPLDVSALGLDAFLFDLDGVVTRTASLHAQAWRRLFDEFLAERTPGGGYTPFRMPADYFDHVDGKPRYEGVRSFLRSRGIDLPFGDPSDAPGGETICGVGNRKNRLFQRVLEDHGVEVFEGARGVHQAAAGRRNRDSVRVLVEELPPGARTGATHRGFRSDLRWQ